MKYTSRLALAAALVVGAASALPALAQSDPYAGQPPPPQDGGPGGYQGAPGGTPQAYGPQGYGQGPNMGAMTLQQFQSRQVANLMRMDADHDGRVSLAEWTAWREAHPGRGGHGDPARSFARIDLNHDGYITSDEMAAVAAQRYARREGGGAGMGPGQGGMGPGGNNPPPQLLSPQ